MLGLICWGIMGLMETREVRPQDVTLIFRRIQIHKIWLPTYLWHAKAEDDGAEELHVENRNHHHVKR